MLRVAIGIVVSTADNFVRPVFSHYGKLSMPSFLPLTAPLGGLAVLGPWGVALGPLLVRFAIEGLAIVRKQAEQSG